MSFTINGINGSTRANRPDPAQMKAQIDVQLKAGGATDEEIANITGPQDVQTLAAKYGISLPQPPQRGNESIFNQDNANKSDSNQVKAKVDAQFVAAGATTAEIAAAEAQGFEGIKALAEKYGVTLPQPPQRPEGDENRQDPAQMKAQINAQLKAGGATDEEIASITNPEDVKTLADKYNVSLPTPPQRTQSQSLSETGQTTGFSQILSILMNFLGGGLTDSTNTSGNSSQNSALLLSLLGSLGSGNSIIA